MRKTFIIAASVAALAAGALALPALAQGPAPSAAGHGPAGMLFQSDANHDNVVTRAEFDAGRAAHFTQSDSNHDGALSRDEMRAAHRTMRETHRGDGDEHGGRRGHRLDRADANHDGRITRAEFLAGPTAMFERMDANHDGVLAGDERTHERGEGHHSRRGDRPNIDADNNGSISRAEFDAAGVAMFTRIDANRDGRVTQEEAQAARPPAPPPR
jgi:Ca2+-binding EF-hand superfamily protein